MKCTKGNHGAKLGKQMTANTGAGKSARKTAKRVATTATQASAELTTATQSGAALVRKCPHGVYWPDGQEIAYCCTLCNPAGNEGATPVLPKTGDGNPNKTDQRETCSQCGNLRLYSQTACLYCATPFPAGDAMARRQGAANAKQPGTCPECGGGVHYLGKKSGTWICADCDTEYPAPKGR